MKPRRRAKVHIPVGVPLDEQLREQYPNGHPGFIPLTLEEVSLHHQKNHDYAAGGDALGNFKRVGKMLAMYPGLDHADPAIVSLVYMLKQIDAYCWIKSNKHETVCEGISTRLTDVGVYAKLIRLIEEEQAYGQ